MRPTDRVLEEEVFFCIYLVVRPRDRVLEEVFLHLFSGATDGQSFGRRSFIAFIWRCDRRTEFWKKNFFLHLFSGATDGQSFGRRSFFCLNLFSGATNGQSFGRSFFAFI